MWVAGDGLMFALMMIVYMLWCMDDRAAVSGHGWLEAARRTNLASLVASQPVRGAARPAGADGSEASAEPEPASAAATWRDGPGGIDDDEHLAAYNAFLARLNEAGPGPKS